MWRFYFQCPNATVDILSPASRVAWSACYRTYAALSPSEQNVVKTFYTIPYDSNYNYADIAARMLDRPPEEIRSAVENASRMLAIERGLADK